MKYLKYGIAVLLCCLLLPAAAWAEPAPTQDRWFHGQIYVDNLRVTSAYEMCIRDRGATDKHRLEPQLLWVYSIQ